MGPYTNLTSFEEQELPINILQEKTFQNNSQRVWILKIIPWRITFIYWPRNLSLNLSWESKYPRLCNGTITLKVLAIRHRQIGTSTFFHHRKLSLMQLVPLAPFVCLKKRRRFEAIAHIEKCIERDFRGSRDSNNFDLR